MHLIENNKVVEMKYILKNRDGDILDTTDGDNPFAFIQGKQNILPALEKIMTGKIVGDSFKVSLEAEEAYGAVDMELIQTLPKKDFGKDASSIEVGMQFEVEDRKMQNIITTVVEVKKDEVVLDGNHPFAGMALEFEIEILSIREATKVELENGHLEEESTCSCC